MSTAQLIVAIVGVATTAIGVIIAWSAFRWNRRRHAAEAHESEPPQHDSQRATIEPAPTATLSATPTATPAPDITVSSPPKVYDDHVHLFGTIVGEMNECGLFVMRQLQTGRVATYIDGGEVVRIREHQWNRQVSARNRMAGIPEEYAVIFACPEDAKKLRSQDLDNNGIPIPIKLSSASKIMHVETITP